MINLIKNKFFAVFLAVVFLLLSFVITNKEASALDPSLVGQWSNVTQLPVKATHTALLPNGKVITWPSIEGDNAYIWDPATNTSEPAPKAGYNIFCAGLTLTADGKLFVPGGHIVTPVGLPHASFYDPVTNSWTRVEDMNDKRWYPTVTTLSNGNLLVTSGTIDEGIYNKIPQVYQVSSNTWRTLSSASLQVSLYPFMYQTSNGKVFMAGNGKATRFLDTSGTGSWGGVVNSNYGARSAGSSVMYANGKILIIGGGAPTKTVEQIDLNAANPKWTYISPMSIKRRHANATLLPTGKVLVTGGTSGLKDDETKPVFAAEIWDPETGNWAKLAGNSIYRGYHSTALLLPDGRILSAGGEKSGTSMEIFSPPYLFKGGRPKITSAPDQVNHGQKFFVQTPNAANIEKIRWIRLGAVTHSFNQSQRINTLGFTKKTDGLEVTVPTNPGVTPPGHYMLFILNGKGVPSVAKIIKVGNINITLPPSLPSPTPVPEGITPAVEDHDAHEIILEEYVEE